MTKKPALRQKEIHDFVASLYDGDLHAKRVLSLANAATGVLASASLAVHAIGQGLAHVQGTLSKHGVKQVDRLLSNRGIDVWEFFGYWVPYVIGARPEVVVALDWTSFASDAASGGGASMSIPSMSRAWRTPTMVSPCSLYSGIFVCRVRRCSASVSASVASTGRRKISARGVITSLEVLFPKSKI